jgi:hypothetical protein
MALSAPLRQHGLRCSSFISRLEVVPMRSDELMKPDLLSEILLLVSGAVLFFFLILSGIAALMGK